MGTAVCAGTALDFLVPKWREKKYGASKPGVRISVIGMLIGLLFLPPCGIFIGAFIGGLTGEILVRKRPKSAFRAGSGVLVGTIQRDHAEGLHNGIDAPLFFEGNKLATLKENHRSGIINWDEIKNLFILTHRQYVLLYA